MQFQVPQFLDVEDKIIGPLTIKQFLYLVGGAGMAYLAGRFIPYIGYFLGFACALFGATLAFYKYNNKPFVYLIESAFNYIRSNRLYLWRRTEKAFTTELDLSHFQPTKHAGVLPVAATASRKLNDLSWSIDVESELEVETKKVHSSPSSV